MRIRKALSISIVWTAAIAFAAGTVPGAAQAQHIVPLDDAARKTAATLADTIGSAIGRSFLPAAPGEGECEWCDYRAACGPYEELRTGRKRKAPIQPLLALRELP